MIKQTERERGREVGDRARERREGIRRGKGRIIPASLLEPKG